MLGLCEFHIILHFSSNLTRDLTHRISKRSHTGTVSVPYWESSGPILGLKRKDTLFSHFITKVHFVSLLWEDKPSVVANRATISLGPLS